MISHLKCKQWWMMCGLRDFTLCSLMDIVLWSSLNAWGLLHCVSCQIILHIPCSWSCNLSACVEWKNNYFLKKYIFKVSICRAVTHRSYRGCIEGLGAQPFFGYWNLFYFWDPWIASFHIFCSFGICTTMKLKEEFQLWICLHGPAWT